MHNWNTATEALEKDKEKFAVWRLEQLINFGTDGEKLDAKELKTRWDTLTLDPGKRRFLGFLLWGKTFLTSGK